MCKTEVIFPSARCLKEAYKKKLKKVGNDQRLILIPEKGKKS